MQTRVLLVPLFLSAPPLLLATSPDRVDELAFQPAEGLTLTKTIRTSSESDNESVSENSSSTSTSSYERGIVVTDVIQGVDDGVVTKLERTYGELSTEHRSTYEFDGDEREFSSSGESDLEDATVVFQWDEDEDGMVAVSDEVDDDVLEDLVYDFDFTFFLPEDDVDEDDEWTIDLDEYGELVNLWKGIPWETEQIHDGEVVEFDDSDREVAQMSEPEIDQSEDGELRAAYRGTRDEGGVTVAVIELEGEVEIERTFSSTTDHDSGSSSTYQESTDSREISGEILWNVEGGHLHSIEIETESRMSSTSEHTFSFDGREFNSSSEDERESVTTFSVVFERGD